MAGFENCFECFKEIRWEYIVRYSLLLILLLERDQHGVRHRVNYSLLVIPLL